MITVTTAQYPTIPANDDDLSFIKPAGKSNPIANELLGIVTVPPKVNEVIADGIDANDVDIDKLMQELVVETREAAGIVPNLKIVPNLRVVAPPVTKKENLDPKRIETLAVIDPKITELLGTAPKNYLMETYILGLFDGFLNILEKEHLPMDLMQQLRDLKDIAMRKDKIAAMQKWDVVAYNVQNRTPPTTQQEAYADLAAILKVFKKIFFTDLNLY